MDEVRIGGEQCFGQGLLESAHDASDGALAHIGSSSTRARGRTAERALGYGGSLNGAVLISRPSFRAERAPGTYFRNLV